MGKARTILESDFASGAIPEFAVVFSVVEDFEDDGVELDAVSLQSVNKAPVGVEVELPEVGDSVLHCVFLWDEAFRDVLARLREAMSFASPFSTISSR